MGTEAGDGGKKTNQLPEKDPGTRKRQGKKALKGRRIHYFSKGDPSLTSPDSAFSKSIFYNNKSERAPGVWEMRANLCLKRQGSSF